MPFIIPLDSLGPHLAWQAENPRELYSHQGLWQADQGRGEWGAPCFKDACVQQLYHLQRGPDGYLARGSSGTGWGTGEGKGRRSFSLLAGRRYP